MHSSYSDCPFTYQRSQLTGYICTHKLKWTVFCIQAADNDFALNYI